MQPIALRGAWRCRGCATDQPNQLGHMDPGGCLEDVDASVRRARARLALFWRVVVLVAQWRRATARNAVERAKVCRTILGARIAFRRGSITPLGALPAEVCARIAQCCANFLCLPRAVAA